MRNIALSLVFSLLALVGLSQNYNKFDVGLLSKVNTAVRLKSAITYDVFIYGNVAQIQSLVPSIGGKVNTVSSKIVTAQIPSHAISELSQSDAVTRIELAKEVEPSCEKVIENMRATAVHQGLSPLTRSYTGRGVVIGIIDSGIDFQHADFRNPNDQTQSRIISIWDQLSSSGTQPINFNYGTEWDNQQINASLDQEEPLVTQDDDIIGHGTHVAGIAAGNQGMAPEADIVVVRLNFMKSTGIADAARYIFDVANQLGKPCVINASLGGHDSPHNGTDPTEAMINEMVEEQPGRAFVAAAGNDGEALLHINFNKTTSAPQWTWLRPAVKNNRIFGKVYGIVKNSQLSSLSVAIAADSTAYDATNQRNYPTHTIRTTEYLTFADIKSRYNGKTHLFYHPNNSFAAQVDIRVTNRDEQYSEFTIKINEDLIESQTNKGKNWIRVYIKGIGNIHIWKLSGETFANPQQYNIEAGDNYVSSDNNHSISTPGNGLNTITVGAYINRQSWINVTGGTSTIVDRYPAGDLAHFSSVGPTIDQRTKPEVSAPGMFVMSAKAHSIPTPSDERLLGEDGTHMIMNGTSMASPAVSGAIALLFQKNPNLTIQQVRDILFDNTYKDTFTGLLSTPHNRWGYGKVDVLSAITDQNVSTLNPLKQPLVKAMYPNPFNETVYLKTAQTASEQTVQICNLSGAIVFQRSYGKSQKQIQINTAHLPTGIYLIRYMSKEGHETQKLIKQ